MGSFSTFGSGLFIFNVYCSIPSKAVSAWWVGTGSPQLSTDLLPCVMWRFSAVKIRGNLVKAPPLHPRTEICENIPEDRQPLLPEAGALNAYITLLSWVLLRQRNKAHFTSSALSTADLSVVLPVVITARLMTEIPWSPFPLTRSHFYLIANLKFQL